QQFFFSSRRRHTRFSRDWSSDVCSSDLRSDVTDLPAPLLADAQAYREKLVEAAAELDDALTEKYLEGKALTEDEIRGAVRKGTKIGRASCRERGQITVEDGWLEKRLWK